MATARQTEANRRNASGPHQMSDAGKQAIRGNAIRHGLAARIHVVLPGEDQDLYNEILASLQAEYAPAGAQEEMLVHQITEHYWRLLRARNLETASLIVGLEDQAKKFGVKLKESSDLARGTMLAMALTKTENILSQGNRYETMAERSYYRAIRELRTIQRNRAPEQIAAPAPPPVTEIRSVPQSAPSPPPPVTEIRSVPQYTQADLEQATLCMSEEDLEALLERLTAPPTRTKCA